MLLNSRIARLLLESAEAVGLSRAEVLGPLELDEGELVGPGSKVEWSTVAQIMDQLSRLVGGDVERLREIGRRMVRVPSYEPIVRLTRSVVSVRRLYDMANRWVAPVNLPHLPLRARWTGTRRLVLDAEIPPSYAACAALFHIFEGSVCALPTLIGLPESTILESRVTPRSLRLVVELPPSRTLAGGIRQGVRALLATREAVSVLEEQRRELADNVEALQRAREEIRILLDRLPDLVVVHLSGTIVWANRASVTALGYERLDDVIGTLLLDAVAPEHRQAVADRMREPPDSPDMPALAEFVLRSQSGADVIVEVAPTQRVIFDGIPARLVVGRDVTERVRMQQKLIVADRLASVGLLAAGVAHEVNNPLSYVLNNIEIARKELAGTGDEGKVAREVLSVALEGVDRIRVIVRDLLKLSRGDEGPVGPVDVQAVAESTLALAAREIERTARLALDFQPAPPVTASDARIAQVLLNLVANALEAMKGRPREGNELRVRIARAADGRVLLDVGDTGTGIGDADLPRVFEPFFTTKPSGMGTGLGLSIAQRLVVEIGGEIEVSSTPGRGATFRVLLPAAVTAPLPPPAPERREGAT